MDRVIRFIHRKVPVASLPKRPQQPHRLAVIYQENFHRDTLSFYVRPLRGPISPVPSTLLSATPRQSFSENGHRSPLLDFTPPHVAFPPHPPPFSSFLPPYTFY